MLKRNTKLQTNKYNKTGFTIVELIIATAVFSVVLIVFLTAFIRIGQLFYKGVNMTRVQETARNAIQSISDDIQYYSSPPNGDPGLNYICIGNHRYAYHLGTQVTTGNYGLVKETFLSGCPKPTDQPVDTSATSKAQELLDPGMQLNQLSVDCLNDRCLVTLRIVFYGADNSVLISPSGAFPSEPWKAPDAVCSGQPNSTQLCATAEYNSTVLQSF